MPERMVITGSCPTCGAPIYAMLSTEQPQAVRTCSIRCPMRNTLPTPGGGPEQ